MEAILNTYPVGILKAEISKANIKGYSKLKKAEVIKLMMNQQTQFKHLLKNDTYRKKNPEDRSRQSANHATPKKKEAPKAPIKRPKKIVRIKIKTPDEKRRRAFAVKTVEENSPILERMTEVLEPLGLEGKKYDAMSKKLDKIVENNIFAELDKVGGIAKFKKKYPEEEYASLVPSTADIKKQIK